MRRKLMSYLTMGLFIVLMSSCMSLAAPNDGSDSRLLFKESFDYSSAHELRTKWVPWEGKEPPVFTEAHFSECPS
jgi:hypothetical protein